MQTLKIGEAQIEYEVEGNGDLAVLLIPGGVIADGFKPLASELTRAYPGDFRIVNVHRRGYGGSSRPPYPFTLEDQAQDCIALLDALSIRRAHLTGHSLSGLIALQLAQLAPERVASLTLIEPSLVGFIRSAAQSAQDLAKTGALYQSGDRVGAVDTFLRGVAGEGYRTTMDRVLPTGWFEQAVQALDTFFPIELPAIRSWRFEVRDHVKHPILSVYGTEKRWGGTSAAGAEFDEVLHSWFPQTTSLPIRGAYHWPQVTHTQEVAQELTDFVSKHTP